MRSKHAFPENRDGTIKVRIARAAAGWEFVVADDGVGYNTIIPGLGIRAAGIVRSARPKASWCSPMATAPSRA